MKKLSKLMLGLFVFAGFLAPQAFAQDDTRGITLKYYRHAKQVLQQEYPEFLTAFQALKDEIKTVDSSNKQAQFEALMRFFPFMEKMADMESFDAWHKNEYVTLQREVLFSFFTIQLPTADEGHHTSVFEIFCDAFMLSGVHSESTRMLTEDEIMEKHNLSHPDAQRVLQVWDKLHRNWPW